MPGRIAIAAAAIAAGIWIAFGLRSAHLQDEATALAPGPPAPPPPAERAERARTLLRRARTLNPDVRPRLLEAGVLLYTGREREALAALDEVLRREPENLTAEAARYQALRGLDPAAAAASARRIRELAPPVPER